MSYNSSNADKRGYKLTPEEELIKTAKSRFKLATDAEKEVRINALDDLNFVVGNQWPDDIRRNRELEKRPCLTINRLSVIVKQVTNEQRKNRPAIKVDPVGVGADIETAKVIQGLIRHIETDSKADIAYDTAFASAVKSSFGYIRLITEYCDPKSFDQDIKIKRIRNPFSVYIDPSATEGDRSDMNWAFITKILTKEEYEDQYPDNVGYDSLVEWVSEGDKSPGWVTSDGVRIAEYYVRTYEDSEIILLSDGSVIISDSTPPKDLFEVGRRKTKIPRIKWYKINACEILDETDVLGSSIPIIPVFGEETEIDGKVIVESLVRHAKDSQRMFNYWSSAQTETIALAPKAPWIAAEGQLEGYEQDWRLANARNTPYLYYKPKTINGESAPPPTRSQAEPPIQAITVAKSGTSDDLKSTTGVYDAAVGAQSNERSGKAILNRTIQSQTSSFHYMDNFSRALRRVGEIILEWIPEVYNTSRVIQIIREDGNRSTAKINQEGGVDLSSGKFSVVVDTGPSFSTKRQEAAESLMALGQVYPQAMPMIGDLLVGNMDWEGAQEAAARLKPGGGDLPPQAMQQIQQMKQVIDKLTNELNVANDKLHHRREDMESKERIAVGNNQTTLIAAAMAHDAKDAQLAFTEQLSHEQERLSLIGDNLPVTERLSENTKATAIENSTDGTSSGTTQG